jgi:hypothetical protein
VARPLKLCHPRILWKDNEAEGGPAWTDEQIAEAVDVGLSAVWRVRRQEARCIAEKLEIHDTPKHGSWLNMAEIELSVLSRQCLHERTEDKPTLQQQVTAWEADSNQNACRVDWQFTAAGARVKFKKLYPSIQK